MVVMGQLYRFFEQKGTFRHINNHFRRKGSWSLMGSLTGRSTKKIGAEVIRTTPTAQRLADDIRLPDFEAIKRERIQRARELLQALEPAVEPSRAAILIQAWWRGCLARAEARYLIDEREYQRQRQEDMKELDRVSSTALRREHEEKVRIAHLWDVQKAASVYTIQKAWRQYLARKRGQQLSPAPQPPHPSSTLLSIASPRASTSLPQPAPPGQTFAPFPAVLPHYPDMGPVIEERRALLQQLQEEHATLREEQLFLDRVVTLAISLNATSRKR
ncbi:hypothetical protein PAPYR_686 [Paratrimastix pyriformis]|uniref:Uncharacterized protein n=1 Tax=Paratrimastix pyriformis TaxID=342808 RepID=A0ABQ8UW62_9EUKA|nr:hypothetical protein PAPYR_686 [Paratrimastix pyriformis]